MPRYRSDLTLVRMLLAAPLLIVLGAPLGLVIFVTVVIASIIVAPTMIWVIASVRAIFAPQVEVVERAPWVLDGASTMHDVESDAHCASCHRETCTSQNPP